jgi:TonB-linked SusC/RagA family outer membrane protein
MHPEPVRKTVSWRIRALGLLAAAALWPSLVAAQEPGRISGQVAQANTGRPIAGAQVFVAGTGIGVLTNDAGRYLLLNVPAGQTDVRVIMVGFRTGEQTVAVGPGETVALDFTLEESAIALDEIVVTGAGVATERRKLGNSIASITSREIEAAPINSVSELFTGREAGVVGLPSGGLGGQGAKIRIRGTSSLSQSQQPIVYIDGIRVDNSGGFGQYVSAGGSGTTSRLDDIDPETIERVEILKGAAAATLYGTEASNGVIQIFTKRGREGAPQWNLSLESGFSKVPTNRILPIADWAEDPNVASGGSFRSSGDLQRMRTFFDRPDLQPYEVLEVQRLPDFFETGLHSTTALSVSGGTSIVNYFVSGRYAYEDGPFGQEDLGPANDRNKKFQATANLDLFPLQNLRVRFNSFFSRTEHATPNNANNIYAPMEGGYIGQLRLSEPGNDYGSPVFATPREGMQVETEQTVEHYAGSFNMNYQPWQGISLDGTVGIDVVNDRAFEHIPFGWNVDNFTTSDVRGDRDIGDRNRQELSVDFKGSWTKDFTDRISSTFLVGAQGFINEVTASGGQGENFPGPGLEVASAAADQTLEEDFLRVVNTGVFAQEQLGWDDWLFATVGARYDRNSAFGETAGGELYPKASVSAIVSDALRWENETLSTLRVRGAIGRSGLQPGAFAKFTTFAPLASEEGPGIVPDNLGNQDLKPEVSTEWEVGAEFGFMSDRHSLELTYWDRTVKDALVQRQFPVSGGFRAQQLDNIGELVGKGLEIAVQTEIVQTQSVEFDLFVSAAWMEEEVASLGGAPPIKVGGSYARPRNHIFEGLPPGVYLGAKLQDVPIPLDAGSMGLGENCTAPSREQALTYFSVPRTPPDGAADYEVLPVACGTIQFLEQILGKPTPDWAGSFGGTLRIGQNWEFSNMFEFKAGDYWVQDLSGAFRKAHPVIGRNTPTSARLEAILADPSSSAEDRLEAAIDFALTERSLSPMSGMNNVHRADFLRWREASLTYRVPDEYVQRFGANNMSVTLSGRNLNLWVHSDYEGIDPEINTYGLGEDCDLEGAGRDCNFRDSIEAWGIPIPRRFALSVRVGF